MESDCSTSSESQQNDKKHIKDLEEELKNCYLEIGYLQDELGQYNIEVNYMGEHELKLSVVEMLHAKVSLLTEELQQSDAKCLRLTQEIKSKDQDLENHLMRIEELEAAISSSALESQCEIESLRLDMITLEERCLQAESLSQKMFHVNAKMYEITEECEKQLHEAHDTNSFLEMVNNELKVKLQGSERQFRGLHSKFEEHLSIWLRVNVRVHGKPYKNFTSVLKERHSSSNGTCTCEEVLCPLVPKLFLLTSWEENVKNEIQEMANQIQDFEFLVEKLKEELREEKLKSKEVAEDLTQAMAELRYEITGMLEEERNHRASIEQVSLRRIQDLEEQVRKEQRKSLSAIRFLQEVHKLSGTQVKSLAI